MAIWSKGGDETNALVHAFTVGEDWRLDRLLAPYDILGSIAHAQMLGAQGIIPKDQATTLTQHLQKLSADFHAGVWNVESTDEDVHSKVEALLIERCGEPGRNLHTGRSRNDQVLTAVRCFQKDRLLDLALATIDAASAMLVQARAHSLVPLPGYTHLQRGMPSSVGMFFASHAQGLVDDLLLLDAAYNLADRCPLGSGASYGVGLPLDREMTRLSLGFGRPPAAAMAEQNGRGKIEAATLQAAGAIMLDLSRLAADIVFFVSQECGFFSLAPGFTTGSSIMPQKRNPDLFELIRGRAATFGALQNGLWEITRGLPSGYSRDLQETKALLIQGLDLVRQSLAVTAQAIPALTPRLDRIEQALTPDLYATDEAYRLMREKNISFREAYRIVGKNLDAVAVPDHVATITGRTHQGSTGNLGLEALGAEIAKHCGTWTQRRDTLHAAWQKLLQDPA